VAPSLGRGGSTSATSRDLYDYEDLGFKEAQIFSLEVASEFTLPFVLAKARPSATVGNEEWYNFWILKI
jgi:hypothetical protein